MNNYLSPAELLASYSAAGVRKMERSAASLLLLGALAGAIIAIAAAATNTAVYGISDTWTVRTICGLLFPFGLGLVVVTGAELFTGNCMLPLTLLEKKGGSAVLMVRNWALVFAGNALGSLLVAWLCVSCGQLDYSAGALAVYTIRVGAAKCALPFGSALGLGVLCNLLVCLGVLAAASARETPGRLMGAFLPVCFFVLCGFEHSVANLYYIGAALMAAAVPQYASLAAAAGVDLAPLTLTGAPTASPCWAATSSPTPSPPWRWCRHSGMPAGPSRRRRQPGDWPRPSGPAAWSWPAAPPTSSWTAATTPSAWTPLPPPWRASTPAGSSFSSPVSWPIRTGIPCSAVSSPWQRPLWR